MSRARLLALLLVLPVVLAIVAILALVAVDITRQGGCDRDPPPDDDEPVPACRPGDKECYGAEPGRPTA